MQRLVLCAVVHAASRAGDACLELPVYARVIQRPPIVEDGADRDFGDVSECHSPLPCLANHSARRISLRSASALLNSTLT
jgi:hypothetical protein